MKITCTRPDGYNHSRCTVTLELIDGRIIERHPHGWHVCPAVTAAADFEELSWLVANHPNFREYRTTC